MITFAFCKLEHRFLNLHLSITNTHCGISLCLWEHSEEDI